MLCRLLFICLNLAYKSIGELHMENINIDLAFILDVPLFQFNLLERLILGGLDYQVHISEEKYLVKLQDITVAIQRAREANFIVKEAP